MGFVIVANQVVMVANQDRVVADEYDRLLVEFDRVFGRHFLSDWVSAVGAISKLSQRSFV